MKKAEQTEGTRGQKQSSQNPTVAEVQLLDRNGVFETRALHVFVTCDASNHGVVCFPPTGGAVKHLTIFLLSTRDLQLVALGVKEVKSRLQVRGGLCDLSGGAPDFKWGRRPVLALEKISCT